MNRSYLKRLAAGLGFGIVVGSVCAAPALMRPGAAMAAASAAAEQAASGKAEGTAPPEEKPAGVRPKAGKWEATVSNGYKGDTLRFEVSRDGSRVQNVEFTGYWRSRESGIERLEHLDPPKPFPVRNGSFGAVQQVEKSRMWWELTGRFTTPESAEGTYRAAYAGGASDTYKLQWKARRVK